MNYHTQKSFYCHLSHYNLVYKFFSLLVIFIFFEHKISFSQTKKQEVKKEEAKTTEKTTETNKKDIQDTITPPKKIKHSPSKATLFSAILPGLGQAYNKKYWKIPILYAGAGVLGYFIYFNNQRHLSFKDSYYAKTYNYAPDLDPHPRLSLESVILNKNYFQRNRDFLVIISTLIYGLNLVDANVDAHLKDFDLSDDLSLKFEPFSDIQNGNVGVGAKLSFWATRR